MASKPPQSPSSSSSSSDEKKTIILKSADNAEFVVEEKVAIRSETIKRMIEDDCAGSPIPLPMVDSKTLVKVMEYCKKHADGVPEDELRAWGMKMFMKMPRDAKLALLMAANYLEVKDLLTLAFDGTADVIKNMSVEDVRDFFRIENDFTPEEEDAIRKQCSWAFEDIDRD